MNELVLPAGGFYTEEMRDSESVRERGRGERVGFKIVTTDGKEAVFANVNFPATAEPQRLGKYGLDLSALENITVVAVRAAIRARQLIVIDEIGPMEIRSAFFRDLVIEALDSSAPILATISARSFPFTDTIKKRSDVTMIEVRRSNRDQLVSDLSDQFKA